jgi:hypothetical protein
VRLIDLDRGASYALDIELVNHDAEPQAQPSPRIFGHPRRRPSDAPSELSSRR